MKPALSEEFLRCPACRADRTLRLTATESDAAEAREGWLRCGRCGREFPVERGVAHLLFDPPEHVEREALGLGRFADYMRADGWTREKVLRLPDLEDGYWFVQRRSFDQLMATVDFRPEQSILDVGSNTCWASNQFARHSLRAIALDIATAEMQGLHTADWWFEDQGTYFERVLGTMNDMPIASGSVDYVFCCEVLHHNDRQGLRRTFREAYRVLKPGGRLLVVNETIKCLRDRDGVHTEGVEEFEGYEHAHWALQYRLGARAAGFRTRLIEPPYVSFFERQPLRLPPRRHPVRVARRLGRYALQRSRVSRRAYLMWRNHVVGGVQFGMIATKPVS